MGSRRLGSGHGSCYLSGRVVFYRPSAHIGPYGCDAKVCTGRRGDRRSDHVHGDPKHGGSGTGKNGTADRGGADHYAYLIELFGLFGVERAPFAWHKLLGAAAAIVGIVIFQR